MPTTAPMRAKANVITEITALSRSPTSVDVSMLSRSSRACSPVSTVVLPVLNMALVTAEFAERALDLLQRARCLVFDGGDELENILLRSGHRNFPCWRPPD